MMQTVNKNTCKYCLDCGGCDYIDTPYSQILEIKLNNIKELYKNQPVLPGNLKDMEIVPSPTPFGYRTRCQLHIVDGKTGFYKKRSHELIEIERCEMLDERLNKRIKTLKFPSNYEGKIELYIKDGTVCERLVEKKYNNIFYQINEGINELIIDDVVSLSEPNHNDNFLELYCGLGNFTYAILKKSSDAKITGIDIKTPVIKKKNPEFIEADVLKGLQMLNGQNRLSDFNKLILDPPRNGAGKKVIDLLSRCRFEKIVYVSCNPLTLADDAQIICKQGYEWQSMKLFDMFPFTKYLEAVTLFRSVLF
ncbi:MAG: hypothetical protein NTY22_04205 [Proteobacteria bacterium]|nr:hypothetical protein [Pseudomonadota bacterium]